MAKTRFEIVAPVIDAEMAKPYAYGVADCFFLGCQVADALGPARNMVGKYEGSYSTLLGAQRALRRRGFTSLVEFFASHLEQCSPAEAQAGDLAVLLLPDGEHVGICMGSRFVTKTERGRALLAIGAVKAAFRT